MRSDPRPRGDAGPHRRAERHAGRMPAVVPPERTSVRHGHPLRREPARRADHAPLPRLFRGAARPAHPHARSRRIRPDPPRRPRFPPRLGVRPLRGDPRRRLPPRTQRHPRLLPDPAAHRGVHIAGCPAAGPSLVRQPRLPGAPGRRDDRLTRRGPAAAERSGRQRPALRRTTRHVAPVPPRDHQLLEHRGRRLLHGRHAACGRRPDRTHPCARRGAHDPHARHTAAAARQRGARRGDQRRRRGARNLLGHLRRSAGLDIRTSGVDIGP